MTTLQDLIVAKSTSDELADELTTAQSLGLQTTTWQAGSVVRTILAVTAQKFSDFSSVIIEPIKGGFGDLLSNINWARIWAKQQFNVDAVVASAATGYVTFTNSTATPYTHATGALILAHATTGATYRNTSPVTIGANTTVANVPIASDAVGTTSNAAAGAITGIVAPSMPGVTVTNPLAVLGSDDETVAALVPRARASLAATSPNGPKDAYNYIAKTPAYAATSTAITRSATYSDPLTGNVYVYIATASGAPSPTDVAIVQAAIDKWAEPWCVTATAVAATQVTINVAYEIWVKSSLSELQITTAIANALSVYFAAIPIGGTITPPSTGAVFANEILITLASTTLDGTATGTPLGVVRANLTTPAADTSLTNNQVPVLGTVTSSVHFL